MSQRLLHVISSLEAGDVAEQLRLLALHLPRDDFELHVCAFRGGPMADVLRQAGVTVYLIPRRLAFDPATILRLKQQIASLRPDVVQTWLFDANTHGRIAAWQAGVRRLVVVERNFDVWKRWPQWLLDRRLAHRTTCIVTNTSLVRDFYASRGVLPARYAVVRDGVEAPAASPQTRADLLAELELPATACLIGACGTLETASRHKDLVWAIDILKYIHTDAHLLILGDGPQRSRLMRFVDCVEVPHCVHFLGQRADAPQIIASLDFFWHAASQDTAPLSLLQAMAAGVPVGALDTPAHREIITTGETGFLAEPGDRPGFARWTHKLLGDSSLREQVAQAGQRHVLENFSVERFVHSYRQLYGEVLPV